MNRLSSLILILFVLFLRLNSGIAQNNWQSSFIFLSENRKLVYKPDVAGNIIPDFSKVGFASGVKSLPNIEVVETIQPISGDNLTNIQNAISKVAELPLKSNGFRGTILLKKGIYPVNGTLKINVSGIVIRGEGAGENGTIIRETATSQTDLFKVSGSGSLSRQESTKTAIAENFIPTGRKFLILENTSGFKTGDSVLIYRPGTDNWIHDLKMDQIEPGEGTVQWTGSAYNLYFERVITSVEGKKVYLDNPVVMQMEKSYGGGFLMKYSFKGRIQNCGIENLRMESTFTNETDENHGWNAILFSKVVNCWVTNVVSHFFGYSCVNIDSNSRNISVFDSQCLDAKSEITGGRRYSFNCDGQLNLFRNCSASEGRHDFVTGSKTLGPNVFTRCIARNTHSDIGPHHRWACGTLYDMIDSDGEINVQDRGNYGTGHGWAGVTQVVWNPKASRVAVQSPWVSGKNYCIGLIGEKYPGRFKNRPDGEWEGQNKTGLIPESLYEAQLDDQLTAANNNLPTNKSIDLFPNPSSGSFHFQFAGDELTYSLLNLEGRTITSGKISQENRNIDFSQFDKGLYLIDIQAEGSRKVKKIILKN